MPEPTLRAVAEHGVVPADSVRPHYGQAQHTLDRLRELGVDYDDVVQTLEDDAVRIFDASWDHLGERLANTLGAQPEATKRGEL